MNSKISVKQVRKSSSHLSLDRTASAKHLIRSPYKNVNQTVVNKAPLQARCKFMKTSMSLSEESANSDRSRKSISARSTKAIIEVKQNLRSAEHYVVKMRSRMNFLAGQEQKVAGRVKIMHEHLIRREKIMLQKFEDRVRLNKYKQHSVIEEEETRAEIRKRQAIAQNTKIQQAYTLYRE